MEYNPQTGEIKPEQQSSENTNDTSNFVPDIHLAGYTEDTEDNNSHDATTFDPLNGNATFETFPEQPENEDAIPGLTNEEITDPNAIEVTIHDKETPIVVLFGPPACGKTMTLVRLTRYLHKQGYSVDPIKTFRPSKDSHYTKMCDEFTTMINNNEAAESTKNISFMLVSVTDGNGNKKCQILEAPGEYYYNVNDRNEPNVQFPPYVNKIINVGNRKIWCIMVEPDWEYHEQAHDYVKKINTLKSKMDDKDKVVFIINKIDQTKFVKSKGNVNMKEARKHIESIYEGIFANFKSKSLIFGYTDNFSLIPFQTGDYNPRAAGGYTFTAGSDKYPQKLWRAINKYLR